jgi:cell division protein FtsA
VPDALKKIGTEEEVLVEEMVSVDTIKQRKGLNNFWGKFKDKIIDLFKEEEDKHL